jgi:hypothetical protein
MKQWFWLAGPGYIKKWMLSGLLLDGQNQEVAAFGTCE